jgi:hypothetical protein
VRKHRKTVQTPAELGTTLQEERDETRRADLRWAMEDARGRRLLRELLYHPDLGLGLDSQPVIPNGSLMFSEAGKRAIAKRWDDRIQRELPEEWLAMHGEHLEARTEEKHLRETAEEPRTPHEENDP